MPLSETPRISVVVPSYNQGEYLEETLLSILSQGYPDLELIVMDGGSTDDSVAIIRRYQEQIAFWRSHKDGGQSAAISEGFARATGEILAWLNSDDCYEPGTLARIAEVFRRRPEVVLVYGDYFVVRESGQKVLKRKVSCDFKVMAHAYLMIPQPSAFWTRAAYEAVGGLDVTLRYVMDYDFFLKMAKSYRADRIVHVREPLSAFRLHQGSKSVSEMADFKPETRQVVRRHVGSRADWQRVGLHYFYLLKVELMYLLQRGYMPLRKDRSKA